MTFDLPLFRSLAFGQRGPDHPIASEEEARAMIAGLPRHDPATALAELTACAVSINQTDSFVPELRARVLMQMDVAAHAFWRPLGAAYLAANGTPLEGRDGDAAILHALQESAAEFSNGFALCLDETGLQTRWVRGNLPALMVRRARWQTRKMILSRMLHLPGAEERWAELHGLYHLAVEHKVFQNVAQVFPGNPRTSSVKLEYLRMLLTDITRPDRMLGREIELAFRIIGRVASSVRLEHEAMPGACHVVVPEGSARPRALARMARDLPASTLYIDAGNASPRLRALIERNMDRDPSEPDPEFGEVFTIRERRAVATLLLDQWGARARQRRAKRVTLDAAVSVYHGFDAVAKRLVALDQGRWTAGAGSEEVLRIQLDDKRNDARTAAHLSHETKGRLVDASSDGMGVALARAQAKWAALGTLVAVNVAPGQDWAVGVVRRMNAQDERLSLGISVLARQAKLGWFHIEQSGYASVWSEALRHERNFREHFQPGIVLEAQRVPLEAGELLLPPDSASKGTRFDLPLAQGLQRLVVTAVREQSQDFQRVAFEVQGVVPHPRRN